MCFYTSANIIIYFAVTDTCIYATDIGFGVYTCMHIPVVGNGKQVEFIPDHFPPG